MTKFILLLLDLNLMYKIILQKDDMIFYFIFLVINQVEIIYEVNKALGIKQDIMQLTKQVLTSSIDNFLIIYKQISYRIYQKTLSTICVIYQRNSILMKGRDDYY